MHCNKKGGAGTYRYFSFVFLVFLFRVFGKRSSLENFMLPKLRKQDANGKSQDKNGTL